MDNVVSLCEYRKQKQLQQRLISKDEAFEKGFKMGALGYDCVCPYNMGDDNREVWYNGFRAGRASVY